MSTTLHYVVEVLIHHGSGAQRWLGVAASAHIGMFLHPAARPNPERCRRLGRDSNADPKPQAVAIGTEHVALGVGGPRPPRPVTLRGIPRGDASELTRLLYERAGSDAHSASWLPAAAAVDIWRATAREDDGKWCADNFESAKATTHDAAWSFFGITCGENDDPPLHDYRIVWWFDN